VTFVRVAPLTELSAVTAATRTMPAVGVDAFVSRR
jgi:hypothetical protein